MALLCTNYITQNVLKIMYIYIMDADYADDIVLLANTPVQAKYIYMDADYADDIVLLANTPVQAESMLHSLEWTAGSIGLHVNTDKTEFIYFNQSGDISTLNSRSLKLVDKFTYFGSSVSSMENDTNTWLEKAWTVIIRLLVIWKSDLSGKIKCSFFQAVVMPILL